MSTKTYNGDVIHEPCGTTIGTIEGEVSGLELNAKCPECGAYLYLATVNNEQVPLEEFL